MHAHTIYTININGSSEAIKKIGQVLHDTIKDVEFEVSNSFEINHTYDCVFEDEIEDLVESMAKAAPDTIFTVEGTIDTSETAGEYKDFRFELNNGKLTGQFSDWYVEDYMENFEDYEDFIQFSDFEDITEEEYNKFKTWEWLYTLETDNGNIYSDNVPLGELFEISF